jgi:hypothetical protein
VLGQKVIEGWNNKGIVKTGTEKIMIKEPQSDIMQF